MKGGGWGVGGGLDVAQPEPPLEPFPVASSSFTYLLHFGWQVSYSFPEEIGKPILQLSEARKAGCTHQLPPSFSHGSSLQEGHSMQQALQECQHQVRGATWRLPSQLHFYMEPQTVLAQGDGEGGMEVGSRLTPPPLLLFCLPLCCPPWQGVPP